MKKQEILKTRVTISSKEKFKSKASLEEKTVSEKLRELILSYINKKK